MIGERLYAQIMRNQPDRAGKITGMLLDGMDVSELLHLLESPSDLTARIQEALDVLKTHEEATKREAGNA
jgi:polyadenylate-binding protein